MLMANVLRRIDGFGKNGAANSRASAPPPKAGSTTPSHQIPDPSQAHEPRMPAGAAGECETCAEEIQYEGQDYQAQCQRKENQQTTGDHQ